MIRVIAAGMSAIVATACGVVTGLVTARSSLGLWVALGVLTVLGSVLQVAVVGADRRQRTEEGRVAGAGDLGSATATHIGTQVVAGISVPLSIAEKSPQDVFRVVGLGEFTGRQWLASKLDRFMASHPCGYVLIEADAGLGKTAFAAWLVRSRGYLSHFSRYSEGSSAKVALRNLSAQLVRNFDLYDEAPDGRLPIWAETPAGFESLLAVASRKLSADGCPLVLVVDGLEEAEPQSIGLPFGLPAFLPDGVYVIATHRTGLVLAEPDVSVTFKIDKSDENNLADVRAFLAKTAQEDNLAARLADANMDPQEFIRLLSERSEGVWVYLRYILEELRLGLRHPTAISDLPYGLWRYYAYQIQRWRSDAAWDTILLPLLATLGATEESHTVNTLARLAATTDIGAARRCCDLTFRPMLAVTEPASALSPGQYEIYHRSFREAVNGSIADQVAGQSGERPYAYEALADELRQASLAAHNRIAEVYLTGFGGLEAMLPVLADDPDVATVDDGYALRHLARHLHNAQRDLDLHRMLAAEKPGGPDHRTNVWFSAHDHANSIVNYVRDVEAAAQQSAGVVDEDLALRRSASELGNEIRYSLVTASIASRTDNVPPGFLGKLIRTRRWSLRQALDHARRLTDPADTASALTSILYHVDADERPAVLSEALAAVNAITSESERADALTQLSRHLHEGQAASALAAAMAITDDACRARAIAALAPRLSAEDRGRALAVAITMADERVRGQLLGDLGQYLTHEQLAQALAVATAIIDDYGRAIAITRLAQHLDTEQLNGALQAAIAITDPYHRTQTMTILSDYLPQRQREDVLDQLLREAIAITGASDRASALTALAPRLPEGEREDILAQAVESATAITNLTARVRALATLAPQLEETQRDAALAPALASVIAVTDKDTRPDLLTELAPQLSPELLPQALAALDQTNEYYRSWAWRQLAPRLPPQLLPRALEAQLALRNAAARGEFLVDLAPDLTTELQGQALAALNAINHDKTRNYWLARMLPVLAESEEGERLAADVLEAVTTIGDNGHSARALARLAPYMTEDQRPAALAEALAAAVGLTDHFDRARAFADLLPHLTGELLAQALTIAARFTNDSDRASAVTLLAPHLPEELLTDALIAASDITNGFHRAETLIALAPRLTPDLLVQALAAATDISDDSDRLGAIAALGSHLAPEFLTQALRTAALNHAELYRAAIFAVLAPHLPEAQIPEALASVNAVSHQASRAQLLAMLIPHLPRQQQANVAIRALNAASTIDNDGDRALISAVLAQWLPADRKDTVLRRSLTAATAIADNNERASTLADLAPNLTPHLLRRAFDETLTITNGSARGYALSLLAPHLTPELLRRALAVAADLTDAGDRATAIAALIPILHEHDKEQALTAALAAVFDERKEGINLTAADALADLAPHLTPKLLAPAFALALNSGRTKPVTAVIERAQAVLPRDDDRLLVEWLRKTLSGVPRDICFDRIAETAPAIARVGGTSAVAETFKAVADVRRWWP